MKKILIIEDNPEIRENTLEILELANYEVILAVDGREGIEKAKNELPHLILCDIMMPELDGYEVLHLLGRNPDTATIPFIFLTAKTEHKDIRKGMSMGADDYLTKPYGKMDLLNAVEGRLKHLEIIKKEYERNGQGLYGFIDNVSGIKGLNHLSKDRKQRTYKKKEIVYREGDYSNYLFFINKGKIKLVKTDHYGKELITALLDPGNFFGYISLLKNEEHNETATCMEEAELAIIPKSDFLALMQKNREVTNKFVSMLANNVKEQEDRLLKMAFGTIRERLADALLQLQERYKKNDDEDVKLKITRESLAGMVGASTESLIRTLSEFRNAGLIEVSGREIRLINQKGLREMAGNF